MADDSELLRLYVEDGSEEAFGELVRRRVSLVYGAAFRRLGDAHKAEDVVQIVFTDLARKAAILRHRPVLVSWLYTSTHYAVTNLIRTEVRRRAREQEADFMRNVNSGDARDAEWERLRPVLDQEMHHLDRREREAILLRFFDEMSFSRIGEALRLSEDAARKKVERGLERLRSRLVKRGIESTSAALAAILAGQAGLAAPEGIAESVAGTALASAASGSVPSIGILKIMSTKSTLGTAGALGIAAILGIGVGTAVYELRVARNRQASLALAQREYESDQAHLRELESGAKLARERVVRIQHELDQARAAASNSVGRADNAKGTPGSGRDPKEDARNFLAAFPQARSMLTAAWKAQISQAYAPFYRSAGLTSAQISQFEEQTLTLWLDNAVATPQSVQPSQHQLPAEQLREILGDQGLGQFQDYSRMESAIFLPIMVGTQTALAAEPLSVDQADKLAQMVANNSNSYLAGGTLELSTVDWSGVAEQAKSLLTPAQWHAAEGVFLSQQLKQAVGQASNSSAAGIN